MKKVCIISSSPRRNGNSNILCKQFSKGAKEAGLEVEIIQLNKYHISPCLACEYCIKHNHECIIKDDSQMIIEHLIKADIWVLATPVYFYSISAQLKLLIDRFFAREYEIRDSTKRKEVYFIITSGSPNINDGGTLESLKGFIKVLRTIDIKGIIDGCGAFKINDIYNHKSYNQAYEIAKNINLRED